MEDAQFITITISLNLRSFDMKEENERGKEEKERVRWERGRMRRRKGFPYKATIWLSYCYFPDQYLD